MADDGAPEGPARSRAGRAPFIMPDGRPLAVFLDSEPLPRGRPVAPKRRPGAIKDPREGWTKALPRTATAPSAPLTDAEQAELYALSRVGQRKQRRWLNDKLLRDMAGRLTAADMASLFKPVPFGEHRISLWERAAQPEHAVLWDMFRSLDMDKQSRVLQKWEAHVRELQSGPSAIANPAIDALAAWAGVSWKARQAMKRAHPSHVESIEAQIMAWLQRDGGPQGELVLEGLQDGFQRLVAHGLAEYHTLSSHSRVLPGGGKQVVLRLRAYPAASAASTSGHDASSPPSQQEGHPAADATPPVPAIACSDILHVLCDAHEQPLSAAVLRQAYLQPFESSSEAGDDHHEGMLHRHAAPRQIVAT